MIVQYCLIAQSYDGATAMSGSHVGMQVLVKEICNSTLLVYCYDHQLNLVLQRATSQICEFSSAVYRKYCHIFSRSPQRMSALGRVCDREEFQHRQQRDGIFKAELLQLSTKINTKLLNVQ